MSSLRFINIDPLKISSMHPMWLNLYNKMHIRKAHVVAKLLQRYPLSGSTLLGKRGFQNVCYVKVIAKLWHTSFCTADL